MGFRSYVPKHLRETVFVIIGISIGSTVSPEVIETALAWPVSLAALSVTPRSHRADRPERPRARLRVRPDDLAMLAATPGHLSYVMGRVRASLGRMCRAWRWRSRSGFCC